MTILGCYGLECSARLCSHYDKLTAAGWYVNRKCVREGIVQDVLARTDLHLLVRDAVCADGGMQSQRRTCNCNPEFQLATVSSMFDLEGIRVDLSGLVNVHKTSILHSPDLFSVSYLSVLSTSTLEFSFAILPEGQEPKSSV
jgi:hypothetical protein